MNPVAKISIAALGAAAAMWLTYRTSDSMYLAPRRELLGQIHQRQQQIDRYAEARRDKTRLTNDLKTVANQTLGADQETVDHRLRSRLNRLAEFAGIQNASVGTQSAVPRTSPARTLFRGNVQRLLRDEKDFIELPGSLTCQGTYEQALRLVASIQDEPWIKRIDQIKMDPRDNGGRLDITIRLTTLFLPGRAPAADMNAAIAAPDLEKYAAFVQANPFRLPPAAPPTVAAKPSPAPPSGFPYEQWSLTGLAESAAGPEAWLLNSQTRESKRLNLGERLHEVVFAAAIGESAEFQLGDQRFIVSVGKNLNDRNPVTH